MLFVDMFVLHLQDIIVCVYIVMYLYEYVLLSIPSQVWLSCVAGCSRVFVALSHWLNPPTPPYAFCFDFANVNVESLCVSLASNSSETVEVIIVKLGTVTASYMIMHHMLIILTLTFIRDHTNLNYYISKCFIIA